MKNVIDDIPLIDEKLMSLAHWISNYYFCPLGQVLAAMLPAAVKKGIGLKKEKYIFLDPDAQIDISQIRSKKQKSIIEILQEHESVDPESAILKSELLEMAGCTDSPLKIDPRQPDQGFQSGNYQRPTGCSGRPDNEIFRRDTQ